MRASGLRSESPGRPRAGLQSNQATYPHRLAPRPLLRINTSANTVPSPAAVAAVPAIMYCSLPWGGGMSQSNQVASTTNTSNPPVPTNAARLSFSLTTPF